MLGKSEGAFEAGDEACGRGGILSIFAKKKGPPRRVSGAGPNRRRARKGATEGGRYPLRQAWCGATLPRGPFGAAS